MEPIRFADGFDGPDRVAFGLSAGPLGVVAGGMALAYLLLHAPLPAPLAVPAAALCLAVAAVAGWGRWGGRPLLDWAIAGCRYAAEPRRLSVRLRGTADPERPPLAMLQPDGPAMAAPAGAPHAAIEPLAGPVSPRPQAVPGSPPPAERSDPRPARAEAGETPPWARWLEPPDGRTTPAGPPSSWEHLDEELVAWVHDRVRGPAGASARANGERPAAMLPPTGLDEPAAVLPPVGFDEPAAALPAARVDEPAPPAPLVVLRGSELPASPARSRARRVTFFARNGGVGRTTLAVEVACLLAAEGEVYDPAGAPRPLRVAYVDLDPLSSTARLRLGMPQLADGSLGSPGLPSRAPAATHGSGLLPVMAATQEWHAASAGIEPAAVAALLHRLECDGVELIFIDCNGHAPGLSTWVLETVDDILVVLSDSARGVEDAYRSTATLRRMGFAGKLGYVVNRSSGRVDFQPTLGDLRGRLLASIPDDPAFVDAEDEHRVACLETDGPGARAIRELAAALYPRLRANHRHPRDAASHGGLVVRPALGAL